MSLRSRVVLTTAVIAAIAVAVAVGVGRQHPAPRTAAVTPAPAPAAVPPAATLAQWSLIAAPDGTIPRYAGPGGRRAGVVPARWYGASLALPVIARQPGWLRVRLPTRPNESTAWVRRADVTLTATPYRIVVSLRTRRLQLFRDGRRLMDAPAGIGVAADPTPPGQFFVAFFERSPSAGYGPFIMVTSAHSDSIADWEHSGDAVIGIHGPLGAAALIGSSGARISNGCIRMQIPALQRLRQVPPGTPITITA